ncbi:MAG: preprotein translocase subunit YajC [Bacteroidales bacterium]|nr:preprotein translocase subunit YajC [Bacteroidales bacterium]
MISLLNFILLVNGGTDKPGGFQTFLPLILIIVVFYFFMIRPQVKKQKDLRNFRDALQKGDKIITTGGIYGKITSIKDNIVSIDVGDGIVLKVDKSALLKDNTDLPQQK